MTTTKTNKAAGTKKASKPKATKKTSTTAKRKTTKGSRKVTTTAAESASTTTSVPQTPSVPPSRILIIDNGGDTLKYGWSTDAQPQTLPNVTARLPQQWTVLAGDQLATIQNPNQLIHVQRSTERGIIVNLGNQLQVWKRLLDILGVAIPLNTDTAKAFGWKQQARNAEETNKIPAASCAVLLTVPPHCPRTLLDQITLIWMEDLGFAHVGFQTAQVVATHAPANSSSSIPTTCIVDLGWSASTVVPTYRHKATDIHSIRRLPLGGRHLVNMLQYFCSYRQWNLMDQEWILRQVLEKTGFLSLQFTHDMKLARQVPAGRRPFDCEFLLPDYQTSFEGQIQVPQALLKQQQQNQDDEDEDDEDVREEDMNEDDIELDVNEDIDVEPPTEKKVNRKRSKSAKLKKRHNDNEEEDVDSETEEDESEEEQDVEALRKQVVQQREEEERRRRALEAERQALRLSVERFTIPEVLFRPSDGGLPREWAGLPGTVVQAIERSPAHFRAALYRSIRLVGGLAQLPNLKERLEQELHSLVPCEYKISVALSETPQEETWNGAKALVDTSHFSKWSISKEEWLAVSKRASWRRLTHVEGGALL